jgi:ATP-dependent DNA helicase RecG
VADLTSRHTSVLRNPELARAFFRSGQIETWGRGIQRIEEACAAGGSPLPVYRSTGSTVEVTFAYNPAWIARQGRAASPYAAVSVPHGTETGTGAGGEFGRKFGTKFGVNATQQRVLTMMATDPQTTAAQISADIGISKRQVENVIAKLKSLGLVWREGATRNGRWIVNQDVADG